MSMTTRAFAAICLAVLVTSCTFARINTEGGTTITYADLHPMGATQELNAEWEGVGSIQTTRTQDGAEALVEGLNL